jgi:predicted RNA-binding protein with PIN domain
MSLVIDGYNLLNATGIDPARKGPTPLSRERQGLLNFLGNALDEDTRNRTTIVFDANRAPPGLPREQVVHGMRVVFAREFPQADALIEELIEADSAPRSLLVVSSDHRLHRAARRRGAKAIDSEAWYQGLCRRKRQGPHFQATRPEKPVMQESEAEAAFWVERFKGDGG